ncbi:uncharacterized protein LOC116379322 [Anarrhichthys ocellatus]|uniref:uncharacterized protein LOC116379322 n=1 Tax=Anarrhichthys ocellatus TaxID=433405 RepID=UPI0012EE2DF5|nr:uncharacterized protein LOC116379322 [Anarrhichthys ocellatus]
MILIKSISDDDDEAACRQCLLRLTWFPAPLYRDTFLHSLAVTQWEKKRISKHLSQSRLSLSDDIITPTLQSAEEGSSDPSEELSTSGSLDTNRHSESQNAPASSTLPTDKKFLLDMLYSKTSGSVPLSSTAAAPDTNEEEAHFLSGGHGRVLERLSSFGASSVEPSNESRASRRAELEGLEGSAQAALARLAEEQVRMFQVLLSACGSSAEALPPYCLHIMTNN